MNCALNMVCRGYDSEGDVWLIASQALNSMKMYESHCKHQCIGFAHDPVDLTDRETSSERQRRTSSIEDRDPSKQVSIVGTIELWRLTVLDMISYASKVYL